MINDYKILDAPVYDVKQFWHIRETHVNHCKKHALEYILLTFRISSPLN